MALIGEHIGGRGEPVEMEVECHFCGAVFLVTVYPRLMERLGLTAPLANACDACAEREIAKIRESEKTAHKPRGFPAEPWDHTKGRKDVLALVRAATERNPGSVYVVGPHRVGKTMVLAHLWTQDEARRRVRRWLTGPDLHDLLLSDYGRNAGEVILDLSSRDCVVVDDLGRGANPGRAAPHVWRLLDSIERSGGRCRLWVASNRSPDSLAGWYGETDGRGIVDRLARICALVHVRA